MRNKWLFPSSFDEARQIQKEMAQEVVLTDCFNSSFSFIAGMDVSNNRFDPTKKVYASTVLLDATLCLQEHSGIVERQEFPYISGFLGFREAPALVQSFQKLTKRPDLILVDGQGISHPRGLGIASHIGVLLDIPTLGVAKSILVGKLEGVLGEEAGSRVPLMWKEKIIGMVLRTKKKCNPLIISCGHKISLERCVDIVLRCTKGYCAPEPIRQAHLAANLLRKQAS